MSQIAKAAKLYIKHLEKAKAATQEIVTTRQTWGSNNNKGWINHGNDKAANQSDKSPKEK